MAQTPPTSEPSINFGISASPKHLKRFLNHVTQKEREVWLQLHPEYLTRREIQEFGKARRWLDGLLRDSYRRLNKLQLFLPKTTQRRVALDISSLAKLQTLYQQFPSKALPYVYEYDPSTFDLVRTKNVGTAHYRKRFEPCYDWGGLTGKAIPIWAQAYINSKYPFPEKSEISSIQGIIPKTDLPPELTNQGIAYCTFFYKEGKLVIQAYRKIGFTPTKYFCQHCLYKLSESEIVNRILVCPNCGNILFPPEKITQILQNRITKVVAKARTQTEIQEKEFKSKKQQWVEEQWLVYGQLFKDHPRLEQLVVQFMEADYIVNFKLYPKLPIDRKTAKFSLKFALFRMVALRKSLFRYLSRQESQLYNKQLRKSQLIRLDATELLFSEVVERFATSSFSVPQLFFFLLLCSDSILSLKKRDIELTYDPNILYHTFFEIMIVRFKKSFKLTTKLRFAKDKYLKLYYK
jgi:hypothetical protein